MCFTVIVGKNASASGHVMLGANDDGAGCPGRILHRPRRRYPAGAEYVTVDGTRIPQPELTYGYTISAAAYETGTLSVSWADGVNEKRVAVGMTGVYAFTNEADGGEHLEADDLSLLILERADSARGAVKMIGELIAEYGFTVSSIEGAEGMATLAIADPEEGFFLELLPGRHWVAQRVPDDAAGCRANCYGTGEIDFDDTKNFLCSEGLYEYAVKLGKIRRGEKLNFARAFGGDYSELSPAYGGALNPINTMRKWDFRYVMTGENTDPAEQVYTCIPKQPVSFKDLMALFRDNMAGTEYDPAAAPEAGRFHNPYWETINRCISQSGTIVSMLADLSPDTPEWLGSQVWFALGNALLVPFVPCYTGGHGLPEAYRMGEYMEFDPAAAWWAFQETAELCYRNYDAVANHVVIPAYQKLEEDFFLRLEEAETRIREELSDAPAAAALYLAELTDTMAEEALALARSLGKEIKGTYLCNTVLGGDNPLAVL